ncbi:hypothetical protein [Pseudalkalibacillus caeni]|uniref:Uncharacterized protein n=1 Tax=Exobacillus caeni TaxID=2574798 RepID=A0A5R9EWS4_9BACL|nr:hypothetical protein [Pseudalkalibacillus caeni]TLS35301.1 hypothetical protein FCL54_21185 [Pseudalkalibacillus caeni]
MNANCPKCQQQTIFESIDNKKYKCQKCKTISHKCHNDSCINMVSFGSYCSKCVGRGFKNIGAGALTVVAVVGGIAVKVLLGGKGKS